MITTTTAPSVNGMAIGKLAGMLIGIERRVGNQLDAFAAALACTHDAIRERIADTVTRTSVTVESITTELDDARNVMAQLAGEAHEAMDGFARFVEGELHIPPTHPAGDEFASPEDFAPVKKPAMNDDDAAFERAFASPSLEHMADLHEEEKIADAAAARIIAVMEQSAADDAIGEVLLGVPTPSCPIMPEGEDYGDEDFPAAPELPPDLMRDPPADDEEDEPQPDGDEGTDCDEDEREMEAIEIELDRVTETQFDALHDEAILPPQLEELATPPAPVWEMVCPRCGNEYKVDATSAPICPLCESEGRGEVELIDRPAGAPKGPPGFEKAVELLVAHPGMRSRTLSRKHSIELTPGQVDEARKEAAARRGAK